jgi:hypothetical protein
VLNLLGFVYYNEIRDCVKGGEGGKDREVNRKVKVKERGGDNDK